jgi:hypothetical protein
LGLERFWCLGSARGCGWWWRCCLLLPVVGSVPPLVLGVRRRSLPGRRWARPGSRARPHAHVRPLLTPRRRTCSLAMGSELGGRFATCGPL